MTVTRMSPPTDPPATRLSLQGPLAAVLASQLLLGFGLTAPGAVLLAVVLVGLLTHGLVAGHGPPMILIPGLSSSGHCPMPSAPCRWSP